MHHGEHVVQKSCFDVALCKLIETPLRVWLLTVGPADGGQLG